MRRLRETQWGRSGKRKYEFEQGQSLWLALEKGRESSTECPVRLASQTDIAQGSAYCRLSRRDNQLASLSHSLPAVGPRYLDRPLFPSIRVPWEPLCCPSSMDCRAALLEALTPVAPVGTLYRGSGILAGRTEEAVFWDGPWIAYGSSALARKARVLSSLWLLGVGCSGIGCGGSCCTGFTTWVPSS